MENNTLGSFFGGNKTQGAQAGTMDVTALQHYYLTLLGGQLYHRIPAVENLDAIEISAIKNISRLCAAVTPEVYNTWVQFVASLGAQPTGQSNMFARKSAA